MHRQRIEARLKERTWICGLSHIHSRIQKIVALLGMNDKTVQRWSTRFNTVGVGGDDQYAGDRSESDSGQNNCWHRNQGGRCLFARAGERVIVIVGDSHVCKLVLVEELLHRLDGKVSLTLLVLLEAPGESSVVKPAEVRQGVTIEVVYIPVQDASAHSLRAPLEHCDAVIALSRALASAGIYPAIDVTLSRSGIPDDDLTAKARLLASHAESIRRFVTQPFYAAESFTGTPGTTVSLDEATEELATLLTTVGRSSED